MQRFKPSAPAQRFVSMHSVARNAFNVQRHLVFATDAPLGPIPESVAALDRLALSEAERAAVMGGTAERQLRQPPAGG